MFKPLNPRMTHWAGRKVWIIGASSGIGAALAQALLEQGAQVALSARSHSGLQASAGTYPQALVLPLEATDPAAWQDCHDRLLHHWGSAADCVIFCAASYRPERSWELEPHQTRQTLETNVASIYHGLQQVLPNLLQQGHGGLVILASVAGYLGLPGATVYGPSKAALINLAELLYCELRPRGLGVYLVNPGFVRTRLTARNTFAMPALQTPQQAAQAILTGMARGRFEISFPRRFTGWLRLLQYLPYRWRFAILARALKP